MRMKSTIFLAGTVTVVALLLPSCDTYGSEGQPPLGSPTNSPPAGSPPPAGSRPPAGSPAPTEGRPAKDNFDDYARRCLQATKEITRANVVFDPEIDMTRGSSSTVTAVVTLDTKAPPDQV